LIIAPKNNIICLVKHFKHQEKSQFTITPASIRCWIFAPEKRRKDETMKKKVISIMLSMTTMLSIIGHISAAAAEPIKTVEQQGYSYTLSRRIDVYIDEIKQNLKLPILADTKNNRTLYPFRELLESIGAEVKWDDESDTATASYNGTVIQFPLNQNYYYVNGVQKVMDTKAIIDPAVWRTYIPIRYAFEALGYKVIWVSSLKHDEIRILNLKPYVEMSDEDFENKIYNQFNAYTTNSSYVMDYVNRTVYFRDTTSHPVYQYPETLLNTQYNPNINTQTFKLIKSLADEDNYVFVDYNPSSRGQLGTGRARITYCKSLSQAYNESDFFTYYFPVDTVNYSYNAAKTFSKSPHLTLKIGQLFWGNDQQPARAGLKYTEKLYHSLVAVLGEEQGYKIFEYAYTRYIQTLLSEDRTYYNNLAETKMFGDIQVDYAREGADFSFYFTFPK
jgi:hypothetical protein